MRERERCGQGRGWFVCDRWRDHEGDHRGYNEQIDEPVFWATTCRAVHSSGVRCELREGHTVNHKGASAHAVYQWPEGELSE
jgi:hypothetical protein